MFKHVRAQLKKLFWNEHFSALLILAVLLLVFYRQVAFQGRTFLSEDAVVGTLPGGPYLYLKPAANGEAPARDAGANAWGYEPAIQLTRDLLRGGELPLWKSNAGLGSPLLADGMSLTVEPLLTLTYLVPRRLWPLSVDLVVLLRFLIAGWCAYLFARRLGVSFFSALFAGAAVMFSYQLVTFGNSPQLPAQILIPALLYAFDCLASHPWLGSLTGTALIIAWTASSGLSEAAFLSLLVGGLWYVYRVFWQIRAVKVSAQAWLAPLGWGAGACLAGLGLSAWFWLPLVENLSQSVSTHPGGQGLATFSPLGLALALMPPLQAQAVFPTFRTVVTTLAISAVLALPWLKAKARPALFFAGFFLVFGLELFGVAPFKWIGYLPVFYQVNIAHYMVTPVTLSVIYLAALGLDAIIPARRSWMLLLLSGLVQAIAVIVFITPIQAILKYPWPGVLAKLVFAAGVFLAVALAVVAFNTLKRPRLIPAAVLMLAFGEVLVLHAGVQWPVRYYPYTQPPFITYLKKTPEPFRILGFNDVLFPNLAMAYGLDDMRYLDAIDPLRRSLFMQTMVAPNKPKDRLSGEELPLSTGPVLNLLNIRYVLATSDIHGNDPQPLSQQFKLVYDAEVKIYENQQALPRAFIFYRAEQANDLQSALSRLAEPGFDLLGTAVIEKDFWPAGAQNLPAASRPWKAAQVTRRSANAMELSADSPAPGILIISETYFEGWEARLNGKPAALFPVDGLLRGVTIPAGHSQVTLVYRPKSFLLGSALSLGTLLLLGLAGLVRLRRLVKR